MPAARESRNNMFKTTFGILITGIIVLVGVALYAQTQLERDETSQKQFGFPSQEKEVNGRMGLTHKGNKVSYKKGDTVTLFVYADSLGSNITAYDGVLRYDTSVLKFEKVKTLVEGIDIYETETEVEGDVVDLIITGIKGLAEDEEYVFEETALAEITFTLLKDESTQVEIVFEEGSTRDSNLMDDRSQDILGEVSHTDIVVGTN